MLKKHRSLIALTTAGIAAAVVASPAISRPLAIVVQPVTMTEMKFTPSTKTFKKGTTVVFSLKNVGVVAHDMKINGKALSVKSKVVPAGGKGTLRVTFKAAGRYTFICTLPGHAPAGMKGVWTVK